MSETPIPETPIDAAISKLHNKGGEIIQQMLLTSLLGLVRPIATTTEKLYRRHMGERYFTLVNALAGGILIVLACVPVSIYRTGRMANWSVGDWTSAVIGVVWIVQFGIEAWTHFLDVKQRYRDGYVVHTYYYGFDREYLVKYSPIVVPVVLMMVGLVLVATTAYADQSLVGAGSLMTLSGLFSMQLRGHEAARFHKMMMDTMDSHVEHKYLAEAVQRRLKPHEAEGFIAPVRAYVSDEYRQRFAQAITPATANAFAAPAAHPVPIERETVEV